ncbi:MAG: lactate racemase domain-containing protein [Thermodesulfobacteriota bacterium]|nr:lactate racemase domain-containing protein [Thermodesulfobacteriota bacterium]
MQVKLPWKETSLELEVPDTWLLVTPEPAIEPLRKEKTEDAIVEDAMRNPHGGKPIRTNQLTGKKIVIVVDDNTRPTQAHKFFHLVMEALIAAGAAMENIVVVSALGIHTPMTETDMAEKIGAHNLSGLFWENHDAFDESVNAFFGETGRGTPVYLNRHLKDADYVVLIGLIEPHFMAGFGGGMKNILPGLASAETIGKHHEMRGQFPAGPQTGRRGHGLLAGG